MQFKLNLYKILTAYSVLFIVYCLLFIALCQAQQPKSARIELLHANTFNFDKNLGNDVRRLIGDVIFKHENYLLYCDSAYLYNERNSLDAFGHVIIRSGDTLTIYGDFLKYDGNTEIALLNNNVKMVDKQMTLTTDKLKYNMKDEIAEYFTGGTLVDPENTLKSKIGYYYAGNKKFFFKDNVILTNPNYTVTSDTLMYNTSFETSYFYGPTYIVNKKTTIFCESGDYNSKTDISHFRKKVYVIDSSEIINADTIFYNRKLSESRAFSNVTIVTKDRNTIMKGNKAFNNDSTGVMIMTNKAQIIMISNNDSLYLHSDTIKAITLDSANQSNIVKPKYNPSHVLGEGQGGVKSKIVNPKTATSSVLGQNQSGIKSKKFDKSYKSKIIMAYHKVKFFKNDMQGLCDSLIYNTTDSIIYMYTKPVLWSDKNQMTADTINIKIKNNKIDKINFINSSFIISKYDTSKFDQIKGKNIVAHFSDNQIKKIYVYGNAETVYYLAEDDGNLIGINKSTSPDMLIYVSDNKVHKVIHLEPTEGTVYPKKDMTNDNALLPDFHWLISRRPLSRYDIFKP